MGSSARPFIVSASNDMTVEFQTGTNINQKYIGFRASYYFVSSTFEFLKLFLKSNPNCQHVTVETSEIKLAK